MPPSLLPGRKEHFRTFPPPAAIATVMPRHLQADVTQPIVTRAIITRPIVSQPIAAPFAAPRALVHCAVAQARCDPNTSVQSDKIGPFSLQSVPQPLTSQQIVHPAAGQTTVQSAEAVTLSVAFAVSPATGLAPPAVAQLDVTERPPTRPAASQPFEHPSSTSQRFVIRTASGPTVCQHETRSRLLILTLIAIILLSLLGLAFAAGVSVGQRQSVAPTSASTVVVHDPFAWDQTPSSTPKSQGIVP